MSTFLIKDSLVPVALSAGLSCFRDPLRKMRSSWETECQTIQWNFNSVIRYCVHFLVLVKSFHLEILKICIHQDNDDNNDVAVPVARMQGRGL
ncbi:hypothetical protein AKJ16_DCAP21652 [Drosera capensis]